MVFGYQIWYIIRSCINTHRRTRALTVARGEICTPRFSLTFYTLLVIHACFMIYTLFIASTHILKTQNDSFKVHQVQSNKVPRSFYMRAYFFPLSPDVAQEQTLCVSVSLCQSSLSHIPQWDFPSATVSHFRLQSIDLFGTPIPWWGLIAHCNPQICATLHDSCAPPPPPNPFPTPLRNPHSILRMGIYMPHTVESKQAHLKVHMLMCDI